MYFFLWVMPFNNKSLFYHLFITYYQTLCPKLLATNCHPFVRNACFIFIFTLIKRFICSLKNCIMELTFKITVKRLIIAILLIALSAYFLYLSSESISGWFYSGIFFLMAITSLVNKEGIVKFGTT